MTIDIRGGVRAAALPGDTAFDRQAARTLPDPRNRDVKAAFVQEKARQEESDGLDSALVTIYSAWPDPWLVAGWALSATTRLRITVAHRPGVTQPTVAARSFATLDKLSGGRSAVHIVIGSSDVDVQRDGDFSPKAERYERAAEYLDVFTKALESAEPFDYEGKYYRVRDAWVGFRPFQQPRPPISIGGSSEAAMHLAARYADIYATSFPTVEETRNIVDRVGGIASQHGRRLRYWKYFKVVLGETDTGARQIADRLRRRAEELLSCRPLAEIAASAQTARNRESDERLATGAFDLRALALDDFRRAFDNLLVGSVGSVANQIVAFHRAGVDIAQIEASTETEQDTALRRELIAEVRRLA
ncbi:LLM class flavin-dependent oxidoreductase [Methylosinus sp. Sm6]|uniref:LLM class flavin-dependent oxidoreductase n=1 Tax=Methylosinus sp. Sm6 TaxID=2866948 RepID=UPI001C99CAED|nr:LLM class flavin-dependent oxidoreductase [Methylosinus sp. Sm6]MBY6242325.1 LLM class flavin-dependent oxidoreductase [Methylosinus sp. Sm6]